MHEHTCVHLGSYLHSRIYAGAWVGRSRHRGASAVSQATSHRGIKKSLGFSGEEQQFRRVKELLWWTTCCKGLQSKEGSQHTFGQVICPGTGGKADELLKLCGSGPARNKLLPCRKAPGEDIKSWSVILNKKYQCLLILAQLHQNHHNNCSCVVWDEKYQLKLVFSLDSVQHPLQNGLNPWRNCPFSKHTSVLGC